MLRPVIAMARVVTVTGILVALTACNLFVGADQRVARAQVQLARGDYRAAMTELKTALEKDPAHIGARMALARLSLDIGDAESAQKELDHARQAGADSVEARMLGVEILIARGRLEDAQRILEKDEMIPAAQRWTWLAMTQEGLGKEADSARSVAQALRLDPHDTGALLQQARLLVKQQKLEAGLESVQQALVQNPRSTQAWLLRGAILHERGKFGEAIESFQNGLDAARGQVNLPQELALLNGLADSQLALRDSKGAAQTLSRLASRFPNAVAAHFLRARVALLNDDYKTAVGELRYVLKAAPESAPARLLLGIALLSQGALEQAEAELSQLLAEHPDNVAARKALAQVYLARKQPDAARRTLAETSDAVTGDAQFDWLMGAALIQTGSEDAGIAHLEKSVAAAPDQIEGRVRLARAYLSTGRREQANALLEGLPPEARSSQVQALLFFAKVVGKEPAEARRALDQLLSANPNDAELLGLAGRYLLHRGELAQARKCLTRSLSSGPTECLISTGHGAVTSARIEDR